jgi:hypothetical protein
MWSQVLIPIFALQNHRRWIASNLQQLFFRPIRPLNRDGGHIRGDGGVIADLVGATDVDVGLIAHAVSVQIISIPKRNMVGFMRHLSLPRRFHLK